MNTKGSLAQFPFFSDIPEERLSEIEHFAIGMSYKAGDVVFHNDEPAKNLYGLVEGEVELAIVFKDKIVTKDIKYEEYISTRVEHLEKPIIFEKIKNNDIFGWSALVPPEIMTATARCATDCRIILIPAADLKKVFSHDPELGYQLTTKISSIIAKRLNTRTDKLVDAWGMSFDTGRIQPV